MAAQIGAATVAVGALVELAKEPARDCPPLGFGVATGAQLGASFTHLDGKFGLAVAPSLQAGSVTARRRATPAAGRKAGSLFA